MPQSDKKQYKVKDGQLYVVLPSTETKPLQPVIAQASAITISANKMFQQLQVQKLQAPIFAPIYGFLCHVEKKRTQTYIVRDHFTIGIGFDISVHSDSELMAVFTASLDSRREWTLDAFKTKVGYPDDGLSDAEINSLLFNTLVGIEGKFVGSMQTMIKILRKGAFDDVPFLGSQLIALLSMTYNTPELLGDGALAGLRFLQAKGSDLVSLIDIMEHSNKKHDIGLQNRRLQETALFHSNFNHKTFDVHLTWRQYIKFNQPTVDISVVWGLPSGEYQETFSGGKNVELISGQDKNKCDVEIFGTSQGDQLFYSDGGNHTFYGGDGDDTLTMVGSSCDPYAIEIAPYYAGNKGYDIYSLSLQTDLHADEINDEMMIYDSDRLGAIEINAQKLEGIVKFFPGRASCVSFNGAECYMQALFISDTYLRLESYTNSLTINIPNYLGGQFNLVKFSGIRPNYEYDFPTCLSALYGEARVFCLQDHARTGAIYDYIGNMVSKVDLGEYQNAISRLIPKTDHTFKIHRGILGGNSVSGKNELWSAVFDNNGKFIKEVKSVDSSCDLVVDACPILKNGSYYFTFRLYSLKRQDRCEDYIIYDTDFILRQNDPESCTYSVNLRNGNIFSSTFIKGKGSLYNLTDKYGNLIGSPALEVPNRAIAYPIVSYADGNAIVPIYDMGFYYVEAQAIQPPSPAFVESKKHDHGRQQKQFLLESPSLSLRQEQAELPSRVSVPTSIQPDRAQTSSASISTPPLTSLFGWMSSIFGGISNGMTHLFGSQPDVGAEQTTPHHEGETRQTVQADPSYTVSAVDNFALVMVGLQLLKNLFGWGSQTDDLDDSAEEKPAEPIPEDKMEQTIAAAEQYLNDCAAKLGKYKQLSILSPEQIVEIKGLLCAIDGHRSSLQEAKEEEEPYIAAQMLGELGADLKCFQVEFSALENSICRRPPQANVSQPTGIAGNRHGFYHRASNEHTMVAGYLSCREKVSDVAAASIVPTLH